jgi:DDB1- and CUL4-associated factor 13
MYWAGPFTDKPYMAILSFLYTQNVGLYPGANTAPPVCRPQFWMWVNPGHSAEIPNPSAERDMRAALETNPWSAPLLNDRFRDVVKFKLWNTTEQLDATPELRNEWRALRDSLFNSGGDVIKVATEAMPTGVTAVDADNSTTTVKVIPTAASDPKKEKLNTVISDMARFVLCHRFGGIYLDADTLLLRDWEDLWGWRGAFAYRWSVHDAYNTAVLKLNKASALGSFLFRTALQNGMDFHPMTITKYLRDAHLEPLLFRIPDALFDSAWLNMEGKQLDRPPQPYFNGYVSCLLVPHVNCYSLLRFSMLIFHFLRFISRFSELFETPPQNSAAPQAMGFNGFFKGAYSYHFHNGWYVIHR